MAGTTLRPRKSDAPVGAAPATPWLTIAWHPDLARIGDVAPLGPRTLVSRLEPELGPPGGRAREPIGDPHLSRTPIALALRADGGVDVESHPGAELVVDGTPVDGKLAITAAAVARGVVLELAGRVALLLHLRRAPEAARALGGIVGASDAITQLRTDIERLASVAGPVLIAGETGAGKERVAAALHERGPRADRPLVAINMATLSPGTAAAQLFGHTRGAFTGADRAAPGLFGRAHGGTLFLDEVFDVPADVQAMLLRALDAGEILPVGADTPERIDVRVIAATDADLLAAADAGTFRPQLYHRLAAHRISVPTLRARKDDIGRLLAAFVQRELGGAPPMQQPLAPPWLPTAAIRAALQHSWPGNVRELANFARRLAVLGRSGAITTSDALSALGRSPEPVTEPQPEPASGEMDYLSALEASGWSPGAAAKMLGISRTTLYAWMERSPLVRKARDLAADEITAAATAASDDIEQMASALRVSRRGLQLRMRELGLV